MRKTLAILAVTLSLALLQSAEIFNGKELPWKSSGATAKVSVEDGRRLAVIDVPVGAEKGTNRVTAPIDMKPFINQRSVMSIRARWQNVSKPTKNTDGLKCMWNYTDGTQRQYNSTPGIYGEHDWFVIYTVITPGHDAKQGEFSLGLQGCSGRVEFDLDSMKIETSPAITIPSNYKATYTEPLASAIRRRGMMVRSSIAQKDFDTIKSWNVNLIRYQLTRNWGAVNTDNELADYDAWLDERLNHLVEVLAWAEQNGMKVVIDLHTPPGGRIKEEWMPYNEMRMFKEKKFFDHYVEVWQKIATRFKGNPTVWGYDLINEPRQSSAHVPFDYWNVQRVAAEAIRKIDPDTPIILEPEWGNVPGAFRHLEPLPMDNVIYEVHLYQPAKYTHQGLPGRPAGLVYPGEINGEKYNKERIRKELQPVRDFQLKYNARIYVGEFSVAAWAKGAEQYLEDSISLFEEYGWDWSYHAYRESPMWSLELEGKEPKMKSLRPSEDNPRKRVVLEYLKRNEH